MSRRSLLAALCLLGGSILIAIGWWDHWNPNQINQWWSGLRVYPLYWNRLILTLGVVLPVALLAWAIGLAARAASENTSLAQRGQHAAWGFAAALAIPFILFLKYQVTWLGINYGSSVWAYGFIMVLSVVITWLVWPVLRNERLLGWLEHQGPMIIIFVMVIFVIVYGGLSIARHASFRTLALDLGTVDQAMWNTSRGRLLEYTPLPVTFDEANPDLSPDSRLVSGRLELIFLPLSLFYWLWADSRFLIALQVILLAGGAIPLYHLARAKLGDGAASLTITLAYLLYFPLHYIILSGFNASALMVPFILWAWLAAEQGRWRNYYLAIGIALFCAVDAALVLIGMGVYFLLKGTGGSPSGRYRLHGMVTLLLGVVWIALDLGLVLPWAKELYGSADQALLLERYGGFGRDVLRALLDREKLQTLVDLIAALGWTPLLAPLTLLPALPVLLFSLLIALPGYDSVLVHNFAPVIPFLFIAAIWGANNVGRWSVRLPTNEDEPRIPSAEGRRLTTLFALMSAFLTTLFFGPMPPGWDFRLADYYQAGEHQQALARTIDLLPEDAIVSAQSGLFPHLSRRPVIYLFPTVADAEFVVLDLNYSADKTPLDEPTFSKTVDGLLADPAFHVGAFDDGVLLMQRGPGQAPPAWDETLADYRAGLYRSAPVEYRGPTRLRADNIYQTEVVLENRGTQSWESVGADPINLGYHWWTADGDLVEWDGLHTALDQAIGPGEARTQGARFVTPAEPGVYVLEWDLVYQNQGWFGEQGGITLRVDVTVE